VGEEEKNAHTHTIDAKIAKKRQSIVLSFLINQYKQSLQMYFPMFDSLDDIYHLLFDEKSTSKMNTNVKK
jgi:hypothetical protein